MAPEKPLPAYSPLFLPFRFSSLGGGRGLTPHLSGRTPRALHLWLLPCPGVALCPPHPQPCAKMRTHTRTPARTHAHCPVAQETCRGPSPVGIEVQASGHGASDSGPPGGGSLDFWDTEPGDSKPRRRRKSLKTFSLTPATFRGIWHWRVSAISLSGARVHPTPCSCPSCDLPPGSEGRLPTPTPAHHVWAPPCQGPALGR